ncbi:flagellar basal body-associated FliL family protein [Limimaricola pyoseonensis]|uniref:Flagellar protein FliL n=1 Tax=Limimaricola pyoseonensis TaxID=521013 RepID=A0A1G7KDH1_9RHOB|nr:flagellar basal body-associated FliL family protein [Limimaricola pyoseonensis]SDF34869.1 flagellar FliL protein [Limimaricola pyoseonensis]
MAKPATAQAMQSGEAAKPGKLRFLLLGLVSILCLGGGLAAAVGPARLAEMAGLGDAPAEAEKADAPEAAAAYASSDKGEKGDKGKGQAAATGHMLMPFEQIIVNVTATTAAGRQTSRFLKMDLALVYDAALPGADLLEQRRIYLRDSFQDYLRQLDERDLQGSAGLAGVKSELLRRARAVGGGDAPREILVSDMIVQ